MKLIPTKIKLTLGVRRWAVGNHASKTEEEQSFAIRLVSKSKWGYNIAQVDEFLNRAHSLYVSPGPGMSQEEVQLVTFDLQKGGYSFAQVDAALIRLGLAIVDKHAQRDIAEEGLNAWIGNTRALALTLQPRAEAADGRRFRKGSYGIPSYDKGQVDAIVRKAWFNIASTMGILTTLTGAGNPRKLPKSMKRKGEIKRIKTKDALRSVEVMNTLFIQRRGPSGYDEASVDAYLYRVVQVLTRLEAVERVGVEFPSAVGAEDGKTGLERIAQIPGAAPGSFSPRRRRTRGSTANLNPGEMTGVYADGLLTNMPGDMTGRIILNPRDQKPSLIGQEGSPFSPSTNGSGSIPPAINPQNPQNSQSSQNPQNPQNPPSVLSGVGGSSYGNSQPSSQDFFNQGGSNYNMQSPASEFRNSSSARPGHLDGEGLSDLQSISSHRTPSTPSMQPQAPGKSSAQWEPPVFESPHDAEENRMQQSSLSHDSFSYTALSPRNGSNSSLGRQNTSSVNERYDFSDILSARFESLGELDDYSNSETSANPYKSHSSKLNS